MIRYPFEAPASIHEPVPEFAKLRDQCPVAEVTLPDGSTAWLLTRHADVRRVLADSRFSRVSATGPDATGTELGVLTTESLTGQDPPNHTRLRKLVARAFTPRRVEELRPRVIALVHELIDEMHRRPRPVDFVEGFAQPLPVQVICELMGVPVDQWAKLRAWSQSLMGMRPRDGETESAVDGFAGLIAAKRADPDDDLLTALIAARDDDDRLSERELVTISIGLLVGGHETTANQLSMSLVTLLRHPEQYARLKADPDGVPAAVEELLRLIQLGSTGVMLPRYTTEAVEVGGVTIPAGSVVLAGNVAANRDPAVFADPDQLDLSRPVNPHLSFGGGIHVCLGIQLARMELQEALRGLHARMPELRLAVPESQLRLKPDNAVRSFEELPVTW